MKKRNIIMMVLSVILCFSGVVFLFQKYQLWTDKTLDKLVEQNLKAYTDHQSTEVTAGVGKVQSALKAVAELMAKSELEGEDPSEYKEYFETISDSKSIEAGEIDYFRFDELDVESMRENDQKLIEQLRKGESAISDIYPYTKSGEDVFYYGIAEPVEVDGEYIGFVRGLIDPVTLLRTSQIGILKDETESYLIHPEGCNAMTDYLPERERINVLEVLEDSCKSKNEIEKVRENIKKGKKEVVQIHFEDGIRYVSYSKLPFKDLIILNITDPVGLNAYTEKQSSNGQKMMLLFFVLAVIIVAGVIITYYMSSSAKRFEQRRTELLVNFSDTILCEYDIRRDIIRCTSNLTKLFAIEDTTIESFRKYLRNSDFVCPEDMDVLTGLLSLNLDENQVISREIRLLGRGGMYIWCRLDITAMGDKKEDRLVVKVSDISKDKEKVMGLLKKVQIDNLTGVLSRETFEENVKKLLEQSIDGYMVLLDLDNFKEINDVYGHAAGDKCLKKVGEVFTNAFRSGDLVGRYGGDEFFAFMAGSMPHSVIEKRIRHLEEMLGQINIEEIPEAHITCSIGIVRCTENCGYEELVKKADEAMYKAKKQGKNSYIIR